MGQYFYLAYGSNLHFGQMQMRCPQSVYLGSGFLKSAELSFKGIPGNCFCTVDLGKPRKKVPVGIFLIQDSDLLSLDRYEGFPTHYRREIISPRQVDITDWLYPDIEFGDSIIYIMNRGVHGRPSQRYYNIVSYGYQCCGLDYRYLQAAYNKSIKYNY